MRLSICQSLLPLCAALVGVLPAAGLAAPQTGNMANKPVPPSLSNPHNRKQAQGTVPTVESDLASEQDRGDAIAVEALGEVYEQANDAHEHKGEYNHIINLNQVVMEGDPTNVETYSNNAFLLWSTSRNDLAVATLKKGLAANSNSYYMYDEIGNYYRLHFRDFKSATPYLEQALKFKCPFTTYHGLALCYENQGQWDKAVKTWETACRFPDDKLAPVRLKRALAELNKQKGKKDQ
jgi:tetratricopeptide (TPR) repeat protein